MRLMTVNSVTFDRDSVQIKDTDGRRNNVARFLDESGNIKIALYAFDSVDDSTFREADVCGSLMSFDRTLNQGGFISFPLIAYVRRSGLSIHRPPQDWSVVLDLALEAGLQIPEPQENCNDA